MSEAWSLKVLFTSGGGEASVTLDKGGATTVGELKSAITQQCSKTPKRLIYQGRVLSSDQQTLSEIKLQDKQTVHVQPEAVAPAAAASSAPPAAAVTAVPTSTPAPTASASAAPQPTSVAAAPAPTAAGGPSSIDAAVARLTQQQASVAQTALNTLLKVSDAVGHDS